MPPAVVNLASGYGKVTAEVSTSSNHSLVMRFSAHVSEKHCARSQPMYRREGGREEEGERERGREGERERGRERERERERERVAGWVSVCEYRGVVLYLEML